MPTIDDPVLDKIESLLKDRFSGYLICAMDGEDMYWITNNKLVGYGMAHYALREIEDDWDEAKETEEED